MNVRQFSSYNSMSTAAADFVLEKMQHSGRRMLCAATGGSPTGLYSRLCARRTELPLKGLTILKLDEWYQLPMDSEGSCEAYLQEKLIRPLDIDPGNYIAFNSMATDPQQECERIGEAITIHGPIDVCILGIGLNGHLALNEPSDELVAGIHLAELAESSKLHPMISGSQFKPTHGFTLGMGDILKSRTILLLVNGPHKKTIFTKLMEQKISTRMPASLLWLHPDVHCFYSEE